MKITTHCFSRVEGPVFFSNGGRIRQISTAKPELTDPAQSFNSDSIDVVSSKNLKDQKSSYEGALADTGSNGLVEASKRAFRRWNADQ